jgi:pyruvate/2-oxoglutarate dehydrogenase complex dihydrolipoamide dehydrogenase (E3) component
MVDQVDVVVVGLGPGGEDAAGRLAEAGLSVVGVERRLVGGECPYYGCIPTKIMTRAGDALAEAGRVNSLAGQAQVRPDWTPVAARIRDEATDDWDDKVAADRFTGKGGRLLRGNARLTGPGVVKVSGVDGDTVTVQARLGVLLASGTEPVIPDLPGLAGTPYWTNRDAVRASAAPRSLLVLGGGAIGLELAQVLARFGTEVTVVERAGRVLSLEEPESSALAAEALRRDGVSVHTGHKISAVSYVDGQFVLDDDGGDRLSAERLLVATGRYADLAALGVDSVGVDAGGRSVPTDERMRAGEKLWAIGDITGHGAFTHMSMYQADIAVRDILGQGGPGAEYHAVPRVTFLDPEIGAVGLTEGQARQAGHQVRTALTPLSQSSRGFIHKLGNEGFIKLVADTGAGILLGATSAGPYGGEVLSALAVAVHARVPVATLRHMIYAYPTFHRAIETAVRQLEMA